MKPWSTTSVTSHPAALSRERRSSSASSSTRSNERWSNCVAAVARDAGGLGEVLQRDVGVLEEGDRVPDADLEEVVAEVRGPDGRDEPRAEDADVEADGRVHVRAHEREVVDAAPARVRLRSSAISISFKFSLGQSMPSSCCQAAEGGFSVPSRSRLRHSSVDPASTVCQRGVAIEVRISSARWPSRPTVRASSAKPADDPPVESEVGERGTRDAGTVDREGTAALLVRHRGDDLQEPEMGSEQVELGGELVHPRDARIGLLVHRMAEPGGTTPFVARSSDRVGRGGAHRVVIRRGREVGQRLVEEAGRVLGHPEEDTARRRAARRRRRPGGPRGHRGR